MKSRGFLVPVVTEWTPYTPTFTGFGTTTSVQCYYRRVGDSLELQCRFLTGTCTATEARVSLPAGLVTDANKIPQGRMCGYYIRNFPDATTVEYVVLMEGGLSFVTFGFRTSGASPFSKANGSALAGNNEVQAFFATVPVANWKANRRIS